MIFTYLMHKKSLNERKNFDRVLDLGEGKSMVISS